MAVHTYPLPPFQPPPVSCPGCHRALPGPVEQCPHCGYNAWTCVDHFRYDPPPLDRYIDIEHRLKNEDRARLDKVIDGLESDLPQVRVHLCLVKLLPGTDVRECGFWMLNASVPRDEEEAEHRPWGILLLMDLHAASASLTVGYALDPFLSNDALRDCLEAGRKDFGEGNFAAGLMRLLTVLHGALREAQHRAAGVARRLKPVAVAAPV
jgi:hypothetical protein